jgi:hypothetical protein
MVKDNFEVGTIRINSESLKPLIKTKQGWKNTKDIDIKNILNIIKLFRAHKNFKELIDSKDKRFLKGFLTPDKKIRGEKINILPNKEKLDKAYSLFSPHLTIHDQKSDNHWDIIFQNPNGKYSYLYTQKKKKISQEKKYKKVNHFKKRLPTLEKNLIKALEKGELMALAIYTLIKTYIRVGNETYYKTNGHKGLTTLTKRDVKINKSTVRFEFIGKDGVPQKTENKFPKIYIIQLSNKIKPLKQEHFIFANEKGHPIKDIEFEDAFQRYCGEKFYPHIVRSYYATFTLEEFLKINPSPSKKEIIEMYNLIAEKLGHKKFSKKENIWKPSHTVTVAHYISPKLVEKVNQIILNH